MANLGKGLWIVIVLTLLSGSMPAFGQENNAFVPYERLYMVCVDGEINIFTPYGDVCSWSPGEDTLRRETTGEYIGELSISPDGTKAVYLTLPDEFMNAILAGEDPSNMDGIYVIEDDPPPSLIWELTYGFGTYPTNIGIFDLTASPSDEGRFEIIAEQVIPPDIDENSYFFRRRGLPVWSPDSTQIAWVEGQPVVYDTHTGTTQIISVELGFNYSDGNMGYNPPTLIGWGSAIGYTFGNFDAELNDIVSVLQLFDLDGEILRKIIDYFNTPDDRVNDVEWVLHGDEWQIAMHYPNVGWVVFDPANNTYELLENPPYIEAITREGWMGYITNTGVYPRPIEWHLGDTIVEDGERGFPATFTPEGSPLWVDAELGLIALNQTGEVESVLPIATNGLTITTAQWTPLVWLTDGIGTPIEPAITVD